MLNKKKSKKGVEWISTVLYVLISITIIGILLAAVRPKIAEMKDNFVISQTMDSMNVLEDTISTAKMAEGTTLKYNLQLKKGNFMIYAQNDKIKWESDSSYVFSEPEKPVTLGRINALTEKKGGTYSVSLELDYSQYGLNVTFDGSDRLKILNPSDIPYSIWIKNNGRQGNLIWIDITSG